MAIEHLYGPFHGYEYDTEAKRLRVLDSLSQLGEDCESEHDRKMLLMAFDIISRVGLVSYQ